MQNSDNSILSNKNILITGGAGFIGSNLIEKLIKQNNNIICLDNLSTGDINNIKEFFNLSNFQFVEGDIRNFEICLSICKNIDIVLHHAALGSVPRSIKNPHQTNGVNVDGFLNMLIAARDNKVKRFIYASSSSVYGDSENFPKTENIIGNPLSPYAISKLTNELYAQNFSKLYGIETIGFRYFNVFGKNQNPNGEYAAVFPKFIKTILEGKNPIIFGDGTQSRDFTFVKNIVLANELAAITNNKQALNTVFNIAFGETYDLLSLTEKIIEKIALFKPELKNIKPIFAPERLGDIKNSHASIEKARKLLNYYPRYNVFDGLEVYIEEYLR
ncbi:MAG: SDR family oxidoreductase [Bacteroidales bacterium]|jgi:UDP-N-acetylglucosamine 4-epimerase|nr:SDR family oxidoreductase [Bacteroidales bacterium]